MQQLKTRTAEASSTGVTDTASSIERTRYSVNINYSILRSTHFAPRGRIEHAPRTTIKTGHRSVGRSTPEKPRGSSRQSTQGNKVSKRLNPLRSTQIPPNSYQNCGMTRACPMLLLQCALSNPSSGKITYSSFTRREPSAPQSASCQRPVISRKTASDIGPTLKPNLLLCCESKDQPRRPSWLRRPPNIGQVAYQHPQTPTPRLIPSTLYKTTPLYTREKGRVPREKGLTLANVSNPKIPKNQSFLET